MVTCWLKKKKKKRKKKKKIIITDENISLGRKVAFPGSVKGPSGKLRVDYIIVNVCFHTKL